MKKYRDPFFSIFDDVLNKTYHSDVKITKNDSEYQLFMSIPGLIKDDLEIIITENELSINFEKDSDNVNHCFINSFTKKYIIPDEVNSEDIEGKVENGLLMVKLPYKEKKDKVRYLSLN
jgi:HSP20 family protein